MTRRRPDTVAIPPGHGRGIAVLLTAAYLCTGLPGTDAAEDPASTPTALRLRIDPNVASRAELMLLPRIGPKLARNIIDHRSESPEAVPFRRADDLDDVYRIGPATIARMRPYLHFPREDSRGDREALP